MAASLNSSVTSVMLIDAAQINNFLAAVIISVYINGCFLVAEIAFISHGPQGRTREMIDSMAHILSGPIAFISFFNGGFLGTFMFFMAIWHFLCDTGTARPSYVFLSSSLCRHGCSGKLQWFTSFWLLVHHVFIGVFKLSLDLGLVDISGATCMRPEGCISPVHMTRCWMGGATMSHLSFGMAHFGLKGAMPIRILSIVLRVGVGDIGLVLTQPGSLIRLAMSWDLFWMCVMIALTLRPLPKAVVHEAAHGNDAKCLEPLDPQGGGGDDELSSDDEDGARARKTLVEQVRQSKAAAQARRSEQQATQDDGTEELDVHHEAIAQQVIAAASGSTAVESETSSCPSKLPAGRHDNGCRQGPRTTAASSKPARWGGGLLDRLVHMEQPLNHSLDKELVMATHTSGSLEPRGQHARHRGFASTQQEAAYSAEKRRLQAEIHRLQRLEATESDSRRATELMHQQKRLRAEQLQLHNQQMAAQVVATQFRGERHESNGHNHRHHHRAGAPAVSSALDASAECPAPAEQVRHSPVHRLSHLEA